MKSRKATWCGLFTATVAAGAGATAYYANKMSQLCDPSPALSKFASTLIQLSDIKAEIDMGGDLPPLNAILKSMNLTLDEALKYTKLPPEIANLPASISDGCKSITWWEGIQTTLLVFCLGGVALNAYYQYKATNRPDSATPLLSDTDLEKGEGSIQQRSGMRYS